MTGSKDMEAPELRIHSDEAWEIASNYSWALASSTRDLAAQIDVALERARADLTAWQPIETAPWEGPPVLLYRDGEMFTAMRVRGEHGPGWCTPDGFQIFRPTHWMPLPPAAHLGDK